MSFFSNIAGQMGVDSRLSLELSSAGIGIINLPEGLAGLLNKGEVKTRIWGELGPWGFKRAWRYWVATGPGLPPQYANPLHEKHGRVVRVDGHCASPSPQESQKGFGIGLYHVDTPEGLLALADALRACMRDATCAAVVSR